MSKLIVTQVLVSNSAKRATILFDSGAKVTTAYPKKTFADRPYTYGAQMLDLAEQQGIKPVFVP